MSFAKFPFVYTETDREFDDALRRIRIVYRGENGFTDWDRFYEDVRKREEAAKTNRSVSSHMEGQNVRTGTDPA
jgi:hypothetical protein